MMPVLAVKSPGLLSKAAGRIFPLEKKIQAVIGVKGPGGYRAIASGGLHTTLYEELRCRCLPPDGIIQPLRSGFDEVGRNHQRMGLDLMRWQHQCAAGDQGQ